MIISPILEVVARLAPSLGMPQWQQPYGQVIDGLKPQVFGDPAAVWGYCHRVLPFNSRTTGILHIADLTLPDETDKSPEKFLKPFASVDATWFNFYRMYCSAVGMLMEEPPERWWLVHVGWPVPEITKFEPAPEAGAYILQQAGKLIAEKAMLDYNLKTMSVKIPVVMPIQQSFF